MHAPESASTIRAPTHPRITTNDDIPVKGVAINEDGSKTITFGGSFDPK